MFRNGAFTLIELVMVILILGVLAVVAMPAFQSMKGQAEIKADDATIGALKVAVSNGHLNNVLSGAGDVWPGASAEINLFELLNPPLKARAADNQPSNGSWQYVGNNLGGVNSTYWLFCPHWANGVGRVYVYVSSGTNEGHAVGDIYLPIV